MKKGKTHKHSSFSLGVWNIHANNHDNRSRRLAIIVRETHIQNADAQPKMSQLNAHSFAQ